MRPFYIVCFVNKVHPLASYIQDVFKKIAGLWPKSKGAEYSIVALLSLLIITARRPSALLNPQFWAEDGKVWYADAYNHGILFSLTTPENGYFQTISRLAAIVSQLLPLSYGPLLFTLIAVSIQIATALFIMSPRMSSIIPKKNWRLLLAFVYLAMPHSGEVYANVTNSQWHLALLCCLVLLAEPAAGRAWRVFDLVLCALLSVSGPFSILMLPVAFVQLIRRRDATSLAMLAILFAGSLIQGGAYLIAGRQVRPQLGASVELFLRIIGRHILVGPITGSNGFRVLLKLSMWNDVVVLITNLIGFGFIYYTIVRGSVEIRLLILFSILIVAAALASPAVTLQPGQWEVIASNDTANRYWFIPIFAIFTSLIYFLASEATPVFVRKTALALLLLSIGGFVADWRLPQLKDLDFQARAAEFEKKPPGTLVKIPINPDWEMELIKK